MFPEPPQPPPLPPPLPADRPPPPALWTALTVPLIAIVAAVVFAGIVQAAFIFADPVLRKSLYPSPPPAVDAPVPDDEADEGEPVEKEQYGKKRGADVKPAPQMPDFGSFSEQVMTETLKKPYGTAAVLMPGQVMLAVTVFGAATFSSRRMRERLGFVRSALPWWTLPLLIITTIFFGMIGGFLVNRLFPGRHPSMEIFMTMARSGSFEVALINTALISLVPGFVEETLFRGYVQRRLLERWTPLVAVAVSSSFFAASHLDPQHIIGIVPVAIWLGVIAWRTGSVWPGMLCHASMNALSFAMMRLGANSPEDHPQVSGMWVVFAVGGVLTALAVWLMRRYPPGRLAMAGATA